MIYSSNPTDAEYLDEQLYSKKIELKFAEKELTVYLAVNHDIHILLRQKVNSLKTSIDSLER